MLASILVKDICAACKAARFYAFKQRVHPMKFGTGKEGLKGFIRGDEPVIDVMDAVDLLAKKE